jgi:hypothetical protein
MPEVSFNPAQVRRFGGSSQTDKMVRERGRHLNG